MGTAFVSLMEVPKVCGSVQVDQFVAGDSNRVKFLGETEFWSVSDLQQLAVGPINRTTQCVNDVVEDALSFAKSLAPAPEVPVD